MHLVAALPGGGGACRGRSPQCQAVAQGGREYRSTSRPTTRAPGAEGSATLMGGGPVGRRAGGVVSVAEGVTGPELPERLELARAVLPDADRGRFEQELDQALDTARSTRGPATARPGRQGLVSGRVHPSARRAAVGSNRGAAGAQRRAGVGDRTA